MAIKFNVLNNEGLRPSSAGQVLLEAAKTLGVNTDHFNTNVRVSAASQKSQTQTPVQGSIYSDSLAYKTSP